MVRGGGASSQALGGCPACGGMLVEGPGHGWLRCRACRSWRRARMPGPQELHDIHERVYFDDDSSTEMTTDHLLSQYVAALDRRTGLRGRRVLDIGAGLAGAAPWVTAHQGEYVAVEASSTARARIVAQGWPAVATPAQAMDRGPFDAALVVELLEHLLEPGDFLQEVRACLRRGAPLYVATPNAASLHGRLRGGAWWAAALPAHVTLYTVAGLDALFERHGFCRIHRHRRVDYGRGRVHTGAQTLLQAVGMDGGLRVIGEAA